MISKMLVTVMLFSMFLVGCNGSSQFDPADLSTIARSQAVANLFVKASVAYSLKDTKPNMAQCELLITTLDAVSLAVAEETSTPESIEEAVKKIIDALPEHRDTYIVRELIPTVVNLALTLAIPADMGDEEQAWLHYIRVVTVSGLNGAKEATYGYMAQTNRVPIETSNWFRYA